MNKRPQISQPYQAPDWPVRASPLTNHSSPFMILTVDIYLSLIPEPNLCMYVCRILVMIYDYYYSWADVCTYLDRGLRTYVYQWAYCYYYYCSCMIIDLGCT